MRPCAVEMTGTVCSANEGVGWREKKRQRSKRRDGYLMGQERDKEGQILLLLSSVMMVCLAGR